MAKKMNNGSLLESKGIAALSITEEPENQEQLASNESKPSREPTYTLVIPKYESNVDPSWNEPYLQDAFCPDIIGDGLSEPYRLIPGIIDADSLDMEPTQTNHEESESILESKRIDRVMGDPIMRALHDVTPIPTEVIEYIFDVFISRKDLYQLPLIHAKMMFDLNIMFYSPWWLPGLFVDRNDAEDWLILSLMQ